MIKQVRFTGLKASRAGMFTLFPLTLITGDNGRGKTTILDAITLAALGHHPALGKTNAATMELANGNEMSVTLVLSTGHTATRNWKRSGKAVKAQAEGCTDPALAALGAAITVGKKFLASSPIHRAIMLQEAAVTGDSLTTQTLAAMREKTTFDFRKAVPIENVDHNEWVEAFLESIKAEKAAARAVVDRMAKGVQASAHLETQAPTTAPTRDEVEAARNAHQQRERELAHLKGQLNQLNATLSNPPPVLTFDVPIAHLPSAESQAAELAKEISKLQAALTEANTLNSQAAARAEATAGTRKHLAAKQLKIAELEEIVRLSPVLPPRDEPEDEHQYLEERNKAVEALTRERRNHDRAFDHLDRLKKSHEATEQTGASQQACPHCGALAQHWNADTREANAEEIKTTTEALNTIKRHITHLEEQAAIAEKDLAAVQARNQVRVTGHALLEARAAAKELEATLEHLQPYPVADTEALEIQIHELSIQHEEAIDFVEEIRARKQEAERNQRDWADHKETEAKAAALAEEIQHIEAEAAALALVFETAKAAFDTAEASRTNASSLAAMIKTRDEAAEQYSDWAAVQELLVDVTKAITEQALAPIITLARRFTDDILPTPLGNRGFEIGRWTAEQTFVPLAVFSGAEQAVTRAALDVALAQTGSKIAIIDEFSTLSAAKKAIFLPRLCAAIDDGTIEQALIFDNATPADLRASLGNTEGTLAGIIAL